MRHRLTGILVVWLALAWLNVAAPALAQNSPDYEAFDKVAASVETDLEENRLSNEGFETLRASLANWRERFLKSQNVNAAQIEALQAQLSALGAAPAEGESEPETVAARRAEIRAQLDKARAPRISAEEAFARADALIGRIDTTLRARQTDAYFDQQRSPLDPALWGPAVARLGAVAGEIRTEANVTLSSTSERANFSERVPLVLFLLVVAVILITRGPRWAERLSGSVEKRSGEHGRVVYGFLVSVTAILLPLLGISLLNAALLSTGILGDTGRGAALGVNLAILTYVVTRWLGSRIFPIRGGIPSPISLPEERRASGRLLALVLGLLLGVMLFLLSLDRVEAFKPEILGVLSFPILVAMGFVLFRLGGLIWIGGQADESDESTSYADFILRILGRSVQVVAGVGPLVAAAGYLNMGLGLLVPMSASLALIAFLTTMHFVVRAAYAMMRNLAGDHARQALLPVLISFALTIASLPVFAIIWGARQTDLGEVWTRFRAGFRVGETTISPADFLTFAMVFAVGFLLTRLVQGALRTSVLPRTHIDKGAQNAIIAGLGYLGITVGAIAGITAAGLDLSSLAIVIGALGVGIGFGLQNIVNNFVSGIILLVERPINEGDWVEVNGQMGTVRSISVRSTRIETFDRTDVIIPNGDFISGTVTNWTRGNSIGRVKVPVGVAYGTDTHKVERILKEIAEAHPIVAVTPPPQVLFIGFGADSLDFEIRAILQDVNFILNVRSDMNHEIARRFAEEGIEIPFAQRDVWLRNPEVLGSVNPKPDETEQEPRVPSSPPDPALVAPDDGDT
jgi:potassium-dependent mechanosensitive channel